MDREDRQELRKALGMVECIFYLLRMLMPGPVTYWLLTNIFSIPAAMISLARLSSARREGRISWAAGVCLFISVGLMAYHVYKFRHGLPPEGGSTMVDGWLLFDPITLPGSILAEVLMENMDSGGRLGRAKKDGTSPKEPK